jgi:UDP-glucose 4-epimerase
MSSRGRVGSSLALLADISPVLVVGGRGFVGAAVVCELLARGAAVHVLGPEGPLPLPAGARESRASIEDAAALRDVLARVRPRSVVNLAAYSSGAVGLTRSGEIDPERMLSVNVLGFRRLLEACVDAGLARLVWMSSTVVLGRAERQGERLDETAPRRPLVNYGLSKVLAEDVADYMRRRAGIETVGLRIPLMLGPGLWYEGAAGVVKRMVAAAAPGASPEFAVPDVAFDAMHVADAGELVVRLLGVPGALAPIYNVAGFTTTHEEIGRVLGELVPGYAPRLVAEAPPIVYPLVSQARLEQDTGWRHRRDLRATLLDMLAEREASR